jgi:hypothetical protein
MDSDVNVAQLEEEQDVEGLIRTLKDKKYLTLERSSSCFKKNRE